jgi:ABC-2 type transport system permease protein
MIQQRAAVGVGLGSQMARAWHIAVKDMRTYYLKPPLISWGMLFPVVMMLAFYLRSPGDMREAAPGLVALTVLFGATSVEAVAIAFEKRIGAMERLVMAPVSLHALLIGKTLSGVVFGLATGTIIWLASSLVWGLPLAPLGALAAITLGSTTFALIGVFISLEMREVFDAMTISNLIRFPMVFLCGVFMPLGAMHPVLQRVAALLPLTYTVDALRGLSGMDAVYPLSVSLVAMVVFAGALYLATFKLMEHRLEDLL